MIENENFDDILREEGRIAFENGQELSDCPHRNFSEENRLWCQGFQHAKFGSLWADKEQTWH